MKLLTNIRGGGGILAQIINYFQRFGDDYIGYLLEHISLSFTAILISIVIGLPLGYISSKYLRLGNLISGGIQILRVIPSLAVLFVMIPIVGVGRGPALVALAFLGIPPILINTNVGFQEVQASILETGRAMGMKNYQLFIKVHLPLALPYILSGIKLALVEIIASATLATYIGAGGLGTLIFTGLGLLRVDLLIIGALTVALLSLSANVAFDFLIRRSSL